MTPAAPAPRPPFGPDRPSAAILRGAACLLCTAAAVGACCLAFGPDRPGWRGAVAFAAAVCLPGALAAWTLARLPPAAAGIAVATALAGTTLRILPPLAGLAWLSTRPVWPADPAAAVPLLAFYLPLLAVDVALHIMGAARRPGEKIPPH